MGLPPLSKIPFILRPQAWLHPVYSVCPDRGDFYGEENMA